MQQSCCGEEVQRRVADHVHQLLHTSSRTTAAGTHRTAAATTLMMMLLPQVQLR
jgi:hypothetical protein